MPERERERERGGREGKKGKAPLMAFLTLVPLWHYRPYRLQWQCWETEKCHCKWLSLYLIIFSTRKAFWDPNNCHWSRSVTLTGVTNTNSPHYRTSCPCWGPFFPVCITISVENRFAVSRNWLNTPRGCFDNDDRQTFWQVAPWFSADDWQTLSFDEENGRSNSRTFFTSFLSQLPETLDGLHMSRITHPLRSSKSICPARDYGSKLGNLFKSSQIIILSQSLIEVDSIDSAWVLSGFLVQPSSLRIRHNHYHIDQASQPISKNLDWSSKGGGA